MTNALVEIPPRGPSHLGRGLLQLLAALWTLQRYRCPHLFVPASCQCRTRCFTPSPLWHSIQHRGCNYCHPPGTHLAPACTHLASTRRPCAPIWRPPGTHLAPVCTHLEGGQVHLPGHRVPHQVLSAVRHAQVQQLAAGRARSVRSHHLAADGIWAQSRRHACAVPHALAAGWLRAGGRSLPCGAKLK